MAFYSEGAESADGKGPNPIDVCRNAVAHAKQTLIDTVILDTAGRLHVDEMPMDELKQIDRLVKPDDVFLVSDAMTGQDAVNSSKAFNDALDLNGVILTKLDGDARGGAALSIKEVTKVPIKFVGVGEKLQALEEFVPERMAQRIMGQGDIMGILEKVQRVQSELSQEEIEKQQAKLAKGDLTLEDFRKQFETMAKMGGMRDLMSQMPGMGDLIPEGEDPGAGAQAHPGHDRLDDPGGAPRSRCHRLEPPPPHRCRQRHAGRTRSSSSSRQFDQVRRPDAANGANVDVAENEDDHRPGQGRHVPTRRHDAQNQDRHRASQDRQGTSRGTQEETQETLIRTL